MRTAFLTLAFALLLPALGRAQEPPRPERGPPMGPPTADWTRQAVKFLADELELDTAQSDKVKGIFEQAVRDSMRKFAEMWKPGEDFDYDKVRSNMEDVRVQLTKDIAAILTPVQQKEFDALIEDFDRRARRFEQGARGSQDPMLAFEPPPLSKKVLMEKMERSLGLDPDELKIVLPLIEAVIDKKMAMQEARIIRKKDLTQAIEGGATPTEVQQRVREIRSTQDFEQLELLAAQQKVRELITLEQEIRLVTLGILD